MKITKTELSKLVAQGVKLQLLNEHKNLITEALAKLERGEVLTEAEINELSWNGIKNVFKTGGGMAANQAAKAGQAIGNTVSQAGSAVAGATKSVGQNIANKAQQAGQAVSNTAQKVGQKVSATTGAVVNKVKTSYAGIEDGMSQINQKLSNAMTVGDIETAKSDLENLFTKTFALVNTLNGKEKKLGLAVTKYQSLAMSASNKFRQLANAQTTE